MDSEERNINSIFINKFGTVAITAVCSGLIGLFGGWYYGGNINNKRKYEITHKLNCNYPSNSMINRSIKEDSIVCTYYDTPKNFLQMLQSCPKNSIIEIKDISNS